MSSGGVAVGEFRFVAAQLPGHATLAGLLLLCVFVAIQVERGCDCP